MQIEFKAVLPEKTVQIHAEVSITQEGGSNFIDIDSFEAFQGNNWIGLNPIEKRLARELIYIESGKAI